MIRYDRNFRRVAIGYAALAGFVDAIGFLESSGLFVSFMSGNSTRLAVGLAAWKASALAAASLIFLFVLGVVTNILFARSAPIMHRKVAAAAGVTILLIAAAVVRTFGNHLATIAFLCLAMGASNTIFQRDGEVSIGVSYMTGTLVKLGYKLTDAIRDGGTDWLPYLLLWLALVVGGIAGALAWSSLPVASLWTAAMFAFLMTVACYRLTLDPARQA